MTNSLSIRPNRPTPTSLGEIADQFARRTQGDLIGKTVTGVTLDSRDVRVGDLYVGMPGANQHGASFSQQAADLGAVAIFTDEAGALLLEHIDLPILVTDEHPRNILGALSKLIYPDDNKANFFGITGTNGKTSVIYALAALLEAAGHTVGLSSTAERRIGEQVIESRLTTPEASEMHGLVSRMREEHVNDVLIEVSAQALVRHRLDGIRFDVAAFNNFSQDHLDEFASMDQYFEAKQALFTPEFADRGVVVVDSPEGVRVVKESKIPVTRLATEFGHEADWHMAVTRNTLDGVSFVLQGPDNQYFRGSVPLFGKFMAENVALALVMLHEAGISLDEVRAGLKNGRVPLYIPGRLEEMTEGGSGPRFFVDYGHTPGAFQAMLEALGEVTEGKIIFIIGADGDRDQTKRAAMGAIAAQGAAHVIICDYNPRFEDPASIRKQLIDGAKASGGLAELHEIPDQRDAISAAIQLAGPNDVILYAGPGHETTQEVAGEHIEFSARDEVRGALREAGIIA
ncbi:MAG: Mur ligase family protein [Canibacter sp.]